MSPEADPSQHYRTTGQADPHPYHTCPGSLLPSTVASSEESVPKLDSHSVHSRSECPQAKPKLLGQTYVCRGRCTLGHACTKISATFNVRRMASSQYSVRAKPNLLGQTYVCRGRCTLRHAWSLSKDDAQERFPRWAQIGELAGALTEFKY